LLRGVLRWPDTIVVNSDFTRQLVLERHPEIDPQRVVTTFLGVDSYWFEEDTDGPDVRAELDLQADQHMLLTVARIDPRKGHRTVLRALALLPPELARTIVYVIAGDGDNEEYKRELKQLASESPSRIVFTGGISRRKIRALYRAASLFCMPGEPNPRCVEGFGLAYLEAAAQGAPSIASALGGAPEVVADGETGIVTTPLDDRAVSSAIARYLTDSDFRERIGRAALARAREFTWTQCALKTYGPATSSGANSRDGIAVSPHRSNAQQPCGSVP
jgi:glycosyltransferase involved in cell wall biosynthesis